MAVVLAAIALAACNENDVPEGQEDVDAFCGPFVAVAREFPLDVPPDLSNPGENLRARDKLERLGFEVEALHDAVRINADTEVGRAFDRYASDVEDAVEEARDGTSGLDAPSGWLGYQEELNHQVELAEEDLESDLAVLGVDLRLECGVR